MDRTTPVVSTFFLLSLILSAVGTATAAPASKASDTLTIFSGYGRGPAQAVVDEFFPKTVRVAEGTTVTWIQETPRDHGITFPAGGPIPAENIAQPEDRSAPQMRNPLAEFPTLPGGSYDGSYFINSGRIQAGDSFSVTFSKAGVFPYVCIPHINQGMVGTVEVVPPGGAGLTTQDDVDQEMAAADALFQAQFDDIVAKRSGPSSFERADGTREWFIRAGTDVRSEPDFRVGRLTVRMFLPNQLTIKQGDTVVWYTDTRVPVHNVLFPAAGTQVSSGYVPRMEDGSVVPLELLTPSGFYRGGDPSSLAWPRILADLDALVPSRPSPAYDPTKLFNSARLGDPSETQSRAWSLTFEKPGAFDYVCTVHVPVGMLGQIIVAPR